MTAHNPTVGGKSKLPRDLPPSADVAVYVPCAECGYLIRTTLHSGLNEKQLTCPQCASINDLLMKSDGHGNAIVFKGTVEMWVPD